MFAFAIADSRRRKLFLARDHLGIKPLYYFHTPKRFAFASELQALRTLPDFSDTIDSQSIDNYLHLLYVPPPRTIYSKVCKLAPGHRMTLDFSGSIQGPDQYWKLRFQAEAGVSFGEWTERLEAVLKDSVRAHLVSDVPFGAFLSGGIDSTAIVAMMAEELSEPVRTFSIGFEEGDFSELKYARQVAQRFGTQHSEEVVRPDAISILPELVRHYGEPFGDSSAIPAYYVSRMARRDLSMVLTGDGGDEAFLGYGRYTAWLRWINPGFPKRSWWKQAVRPVLQRIMPARFPPDFDRRKARLQDWLGWIGGTNDNLRAALWRPEYLHLISQPVDEIEQVENDAASVPPEQFGQYLDYRTYLPHDVLTKVDTASMNHGLETRTPLVDVKVVEFAATIPWQMNMRQDADGAWTGKHLLKRIVAKNFDSDFVERKKAGFRVPLNHWFSEGGALRRELSERLLAPDAEIYGYFRPKAVQRLVAEHGVAGRDHSATLWQLLFLENWLVHMGGTRPGKQEVD
jgi:asparagine synthase (glutamine-hydrolysing)